MSFGHSHVCRHPNSDIDYEQISTIIDFLGKNEHSGYTYSFHIPTTCKRS